MKSERKVISTIQEKSILLNPNGTKLHLNSTKYYIFSAIFIVNSLYYILLNYPQSLENTLLSSPYNFSSFEYGIFYGISSLPNMILPLFFGIYIDKNGHSSWLTMLLGLSLIFGMILTTMGAYKISYSLMIIGRLFMGLGVENISVIIKKFLLQITTKEEIIAAWGIFLASNRLGAMSASLIPSLIYSNTNSVTQCFGVGIYLSVALIIFLFLALILTKKTHLLNEETITNVEMSSFSILKSFVKETSGLFWLLILISFCNISMFFGFFSTANNFLTDEANMGSIEASYFLIVFSSLCACFQPAAGFLLSKTGYYVSAIIIGSFINIIAFFTFLDMYGTNDSYLTLLPILLLALGYSFCATFMFSCFGLIVHPKNFGLAYGFLQNSLNAGMLFGPTIFGLIKGLTFETYSGYYWAIIETVGLEGIVIILALIVAAIDLKTIKKLTVKRLDDC